MSSLKTNKNTSKINDIKKDDLYYLKLHLKKPLIMLLVSIIQIAICYFLDKIINVSQGDSLGIVSFEPLTLNVLLGLIEIMGFCLFFISLIYLLIPMFLGLKIIFKKLFKK